MSSDFLTIYDDVLSATELHYLRQTCSSSIPAGLVYEKANTIHDKALDGDVICGIILRLLAPTNVINDYPDSDVEFWINQSKEVASRVEYHVDNDEKLRSATGVVRSPKTGYIFYLSKSDEDVGGTYFNPPVDDILLDPNLFKIPYFADVVSADGVSVSFKENRLVAFDGRCPHTVIPFSTALGKLRTSLLFNLW